MKLLLCSMVAFALLALLAGCKPLPVVYTSWTTKRCVRVELPNGSPGSCDQLPPRYDNVWVH